MIMLIKNMLLFLTSKHSKFIFEPSFVGIHQVLREIYSLLNMSFNLEIFANFISGCTKLVTLDQRSQT